MLANRKTFAFISLQKWLYITYNHVWHVVTKGSSANFSVKNKVLPFSYIPNFSSSSVFNIWIIDTFSLKASLPMSSEQIF